MKEFSQRYSAIGASAAAQALLRGEGTQQSLLNAQGLTPDIPTPSLIAGRDYQYDGTGAPQVIADLLHGRTTYSTDQNGQVTQAKKETSSGTVTETFGYHPTMDVQSSGRQIINQYDKVLEETQETWGREPGGRIAKRVKKHPRLTHFCK